MNTSRRFSSHLTDVVLAEGRAPDPWGRWSGSKLACGLWDPPPKNLGPTATLPTPKMPSRLTLRRCLHHSQTQFPSLPTGSLSLGHREGVHEGPGGSRSRCGALAPCLQAGPALPGSVGEAPVERDWVGLGTPKQLRPERGNLGQSRQEEGAHRPEAGFGLGAPGLAVLRVLLQSGGDRSPMTIKRKGQCLV